MPSIILQLTVTLPLANTPVLDVRIGDATYVTYVKGSKTTDLALCPAGSEVKLQWEIAGHPIILAWTIDTFTGVNQQVRLHQILSDSKIRVTFSQRSIMSKTGYVTWTLDFVTRPAKFNYGLTIYYAPLGVPNPLLYQVALDQDEEIKFQLRDDEQNISKDLRFWEPTVFHADDISAFRLPSRGDRLCLVASGVDFEQKLSLGGGVTLYPDEIDRELILWEECTHTYTAPGVRKLTFGAANIRTGNMIESWNQNVARRFYEGLGVDHEFTLLPELTVKSGGQQYWVAEITVYEQLPLYPKPLWQWYRADGSDEYPDFPGDGNSPPSFPNSFVTRVSAVRLNMPQTIPLQVSAKLRMFRTESGDSTTIENMTLTTPENVPGGSVWGLSLSGQGWGEKGPQIIRAGAFELHLPKIGTGQPYVIACGAHFDMTSRTHDDGPVMPVVQCTVDRLPLFDVVPAGEDDLDRDSFALLNASESNELARLAEGQRDPVTQALGEIGRNMRREGALVFRKPGHDVAGTSDGSWTMHYQEVSSDSVRRMVSMLLRFTAPHGAPAGPADESVLVLDRLPFTFAEVHFHPLTATPDDTTVAQWDRASRAWKIVQIANAPTYLLLPPQVVGEEFVTAEARKNYPHGIGDGTTSQMPLGTPTIVTMMSSQTFNYVDVPWNIRRLVTDRTVNVKSFDYEMLYGMACHTDAPNMRLTEAETLYGRLRGNLPESPTPLPAATYDFRYLNARLHWSRVYREYQSRLGVFVLADATQTDQERFIDGHFTFCDLRLNKPVKTDATSAIIPYLTQSRLASDPPAAGDDDSRFKGGALVGVDDDTIYSQIVQTGHSKKNESAVIDPRLSVLGGFGTVRAGFGASTLIGTEAMGRTVAYTVERLGRIGAFWNRAKHVIVYRRTVVASRQFFTDQKPVSAFKGYPLVRKVEEYVEFLEPERMFGAEPVGTQGSFLKGFKCGDRKRIPVNSAWGSTVPGEGLKIPLWNAPAAEQLSDVYPKPQFYLEVSTTEPAFGSTDAAPRFLAQDCLLLHPEEVVFYTSTSDVGTDTDVWHAVEGVDFVSYPMIVPDATLYDGGDLSAVPLPEAAAPPGWESVTFTIKPPASGVHATDGIVKTSKPLGARVSKVTVSRGAAARPITVRDLLRNDPNSFNLYKTHATAAAGVPQGFADLRRLLATPQATAAQITRQLKELQQHCDTLAQGLPLALQTLTAKVRQPYLDAGNKFKSDIGNVQAAIAGRLALLQTKIDAAQNDADAEIVRARRLVELIEATAKEDIDWPANKLREKLDASLRGWSVAIEAFCGSYSPLRPLAVALREVASLLTATQTAIAAAVTADVTTILNKGQLARTQFEALVRAVRAALTDLQRQIRPIDPALILLILKTDALAGKLEALEQTAAAAALDPAQLALARDAANKLKVDMTALAATLKSMADSLPERNVDLLQQSGLIGKLRDLADAGDVAGLQAKIADIKSAPKLLIDELAANSAAYLSTIADNTQTALRKLADQVALLIAQQGLALGGLGAEFQTLSGQLQGLLNGLPSIDVLQAKLNEFSQTVSGSVRSAQQSLDQYVRQPVMEAYRPLSGQADKLIRTVRALGEPPQVPNLDIKPPVVAYIYDYLNTKVPITPVLARAHQIDQALNAMGISLPAVHIGDVLVPPNLSKFDLNRIFPNFAGLRLGGLFSGIKLPTIARENIALTHDWEPQLRRGWLQANVNLPFAERMVVFQAGFISFCLSEAAFRAESRVQIDGTRTQQFTNGSIAGRWSIQIGDSTSLIDFADTALVFDDTGKLQFKFNPRGIRLADALKAVTALVQSFSDPESGFTYGATPAGVKCAFALPVPELAALTSGMTGLKFSTSLELDFSTGFVIRLSVGVSTKDRPFNFAVFILGGCGYLQAGVGYDVETGMPPRPMLEMAIGCSGGLAIALGPISGSIYAQFAIELRIANGGYTTGAFFQITGHVSILGIISVDLVFRLEATYSNGVMTASGHFSIKIKLFMFSLSVSRDVTMHLGSHTQAQLEMALPPGNQLAALADASGFVPGLASAFDAAENFAIRYVGLLI